MNYKLKVDKKKAGLQLYILIEKSGYSREEIADFLELSSPRVIYDWASGKKMPGIENLLNLARLFDVHVEDILAT